MKYIYKPFKERVADHQYNDLLKKLIRSGIDKVPIHARLEENKGTGHLNSREITGELLSFDLRNGFPLITIRDLENAFSGCLGEMIAFINGATTLDELVSYGCPAYFWKNWVTPEKSKLLGLELGNLGRGSYGNSFTNFQTEEGSSFNQIDALVNNMKKRPFLRTHVVTSWNPPYSMGDDEQNRPREVAVAPCHANFMHFVVFDHLEEIQMSVVFRSSDVPVGLPMNIAQWCAFGMMVAYTMGNDYKLTQFNVFLTNPHYYDIQRECIDELLSLGIPPFPTVKINPKREIKRIQDFRKDDFELTDYHPGPKMKIPTPT